jgi:uncharacterized protein
MSRHGSGGLEGGAPPARRLARPTPGRRLPLALPSARLAARTAPAGAREIIEVQRRGSVEEIAHCKRTLLITFRRDGRAVPTPVWAAVGEGLLYVRTERRAGKVKRLANDPRLLAAPCTVRGRPLGAPLEAYARLLESSEEERVAEGVLARRYGAGRVLFELTMDLMGVDMGYLEIAPRAWD